MHLDIACLIVLAMFGLIGFLKGFLSQLISIAAIVAGLLGTMVFSGPASTWVVGWLVPRAPDLQPALVRIGVFVVLLFTLYILAAATLEAIKKKLMHSFALQLNDRLLGMVVGLLKGLTLVLFAILVMDGTKGLVERIASPRGYDSYQSAMDVSDVFSGGRYLIGFSRDRVPVVSSMLHQAELWLPPAAQTNKPAQKPEAPLLNATSPIPFTPSAPPAAVRTNQLIPFVPPAPPAPQSSPRSTQ